MTSRILITGANGLLGGVLARHLTKLGHIVVATGRQPLPNGGEHSSYCPCDLSNVSGVRALFAGPRFDAVIHAAARLRQDSTAAGPFVRDNILATAILSDEARAARVNRFIFVSTISVYSGDGPFHEGSATNASDLYGWTKRCAEEVCLDRGWPNGFPVVIRLGGLHGHPRHNGVIQEFFQRARNNEPISIDEPDSRATITFLDDVIGVVQRILQHSGPPPSPIYNVATAEAATFQELAAAIFACLGKAGSIKTPATQRRRNRVLDTTRLRNELRYQPISLREHLIRFANEAEP